MVSTIKFSQFATGNISNNTNQFAGLTSPTGTNIKSSFFNSWTTSTRPAIPYNGQDGYNTSLGQWEYWNGSAWLPFAAGGSGTILSGTAGQLAFYATTGTTLSGLTTLANAGLLTNGAGIPGWVAYTGSGAPVLANTPTLITPNIGAAKALSVAFGNGTGILDNNGNNQMLFTQMASAVNYLNVTNAATGLSPSLMAAGADTNIVLELAGKGTGGVNIVGSTNSTVAPSGILGQIISSTILSSSAVPLTTATATEVTHIDLPIGNWVLMGNVTLLSATANMTTTIMGINPASVGFPNSSLVAGTANVLISNDGRVCPSYTVNVTSPTTYYLVAFATFASGSVSACGHIHAQRIY